MVRSRPILGVLSVTLAIMAFVAIWDFELSQSVQTSTEPRMNLVGVVGAEGSFWSFYFFGVATWLMPLYLFWLGVRLFRKQMPRRRVQVACASIFSLACASGLAAMGGSGEQVADSVFGHQVPEGFGFGGFIGSKFAPVLLQPYVGPFGAFLFFLLGFVGSSIIVFTDNLSRLVNGCVSGSVHFWSLGIPRERRRLKAERAEEKRLAKEGLLWQRKGCAARRAKPEAKSKPRRLVVTNSGQESGNEDLDGRKPSLLSSALSMGSALRESGFEAEEKLGPAVIEEALVEEESFDAPEPLDVLGNRLDPSVIKIVSGEKTEKRLSQYPRETRWLRLPPLELLAEAPDGTDFSNEDHAGTMEALVRTLDEFGVKVIPGEIHTGPVITRYEVTPAPGVESRKS